MNIQTATNKEIEQIKIWYRNTRMEEITCRPIVNGRRIAPSNEIVSLIYYEDNSNVPAGKFTYFDINPRNKSAEFGYIVNPSMRGLGIGKQMIKHCINKLFLTADFNKLYCQTASFNIPSIKMLERAGLKKDAVLRDHHELGGKLYDDYIYSILRSEWLECDYFKN